ncbi:MAG TPA: hypothetical protein VGP70_19500 [Actinomadura sp.]|nr:hypothetical protein [Actinomadura sp.]
MGPPDPRQRFEALYPARYPAVLSHVPRRTGSPDDKGKPVPTPPPGD